MDLWNFMDVWMHRFMDECMYVSVCLPAYLPGSAHTRARTHTRTYRTNIQIRRLRLKLVY